MTTMRAKMVLHMVTKHSNASESLHFQAVAASSYPEDGSDEDNTYAKFTPSAAVNLQITNPALIGKFQPGEVYYVDFYPAPVPKQD